MFCVIEKSARSAVIVINPLQGVRDLNVSCKRSPELSIVVNANRFLQG